MNKHFFTFGSIVTLLVLATSVGGIGVASAADEAGRIAKAQASVDARFDPAAEAGGRSFIRRPLAAAVFQIVDATNVDQLLEAKARLVAQPGAHFDQVSRCDLYRDLAMRNHVRGQFGRESLLQVIG